MTFDLLNVIMITYEMFEKDLSIDTFETALTEIDCRNTFVPNQSRLLVHAMNELLLDIIPNWCYNDDLQWYFTFWFKLWYKSFTPGIIHFVDIHHRPVLETESPLFYFGSSELALSYTKNHTERNSDAFDMTDLSNLNRMIGNIGITSILNELNLHIQKLVRHFMENHLASLCLKLPVGFQLPNFDTSAESLYYIL